MSIATISAERLAQLVRGGETPELLDVRTPAEYREVHLAFARNVPLDQLNPAAVMTARGRAADQPLYVICQAGKRGQTACAKFVEAGYANVVNVEGGTQACLALDLPLVRGRKSISLERQVRIVAGSLVLLGLLLGWQVHPAGFGLAAFVGGGLVFAGVTDLCGMGLLLARMPWNR